MTSWTPLSKITSSFTKVNKSTAPSYTKVSKTTTRGLWNALTFPWLEALPWQFSGEGAISWTNRAKS